MNSLKIIHVVCPRCGKVVPQGSYCIYCGYPLKNARKIFHKRQSKQLENNYIEIYKRLEDLEEELINLKKVVGIYKHKTVIIRSSSLFLRKE